MRSNPNQNPGLPTNQKGQVKADQKQSLSHKAGDTIEKVGQAVKRVGAEKIGNAIYKSGNKIEHSDENK